MALPFYKRLVLNKWALNLFGYTKLEDFADYLKDDTLEGFDEDNISKFAQVIGLHLTSASPSAGNRFWHMMKTSFGIGNLLPIRAVKVAN